MTKKQKPKIIDGIFEVHPNGDIYRLKNDEKTLCRKMLIEPRNNGITYHRVDAWKDDRTISRYAHVLYARAFVENPDAENNTIVRARDGNLTNLSADNLYWASRKDVANSNLTDAHEARKNKRSKRTAAHKQAIIDDLKYIELDKLTPTQRKYMALRQQGADYSEIAERFGVTRQAVQSNITRTIKQYYNREHRTYKKRK